MLSSSYFISKKWLTSLVGNRKLKQDHFSKTSHSINFKQAEARKIFVWKYILLYSLVGQHWYKWQRYNNVNI